jgi:hypothetical protein
MSWRISRMGPDLGRTFDTSAPSLKQVYTNEDATMQRSSDITGYQLHATDGAIGTIGTITDLLLDDRHFGLRWVVVDTGTWLSGRKVLLPPSALGTRP